MLRLITTHLIWLFAALMAEQIALGSELCVTVMDYARSPLPRATVKAVDLSSAKEFQAQSSRDGLACLAPLPAGRYSVEVSAQGFLQVVYRPVRVEAGPPTRLSFWLPFGDIEEGGIGSEATVSGALLTTGGPVSGAQICLVGKSGSLRICTATNQLGEYVLVVPIGVYACEISMGPKQVKRSSIDVSTPGTYRDRLSFSEGRSQ